MVSHKLKWSAFIRNLDGHTSELRCALPIHILSPILAEEAKLASSGARSLLFGPSGVLVPVAEGMQQAELPSYSDHVRDRVANFGTSGYQSSLAVSGSTTNASGSGSNTPAPFVRSPWATPHGSPSNVDGTTSPPNGTSAPGAGYFPDQTPRPAINWADSELLSSLSAALPQQASQNSSRSGSRQTSPATSRPTSRPSSRPSSRPTSRASSPVRGESTNNIARSPTDGTDALSMRPHASSNASSLGLDYGAHGSDHYQPHRTSSGGFLSNMHLGKSLRPFTSMHHGPSSGSRSGTSTPASQEDRSHSTSSLSGFFHAGQRTASGRQSTSDVTSHSGYDSPRTSTSHGGDVAAQTIAALEAHQAKKAGKKPGFGFGHRSKGKQKAGMFSSMHAHDDDDTHSHHSGDLPHEHDHHDEQEHDDHHQQGEEEQEDVTGARYLSQVPSYEIASRGFLGGGVVPLPIGLPSYDESEVSSRPTTPLASPRFGPQHDHATTGSSAAPHSLLSASTPAHTT